MDAESLPDASIVTYFGAVEDPRSEQGQLHPISSIITIAISAVICGADSFVAVERWGKAKFEWLSTFLDLPHGIPSHDTFTRVFCILNPKVLQLIFLGFLRALLELQG
jgi:hypothetical protein